MNEWLLIGGLIVVLCVLVDAVWTTLWPEGGAGPMTDKLGTWLWTGAKKVARLGGRMNHRVLSTAGPLVIVATVVNWFILMWIGIFLVYSSHPDAVVSSQLQAPADFSQRIWFTLYTTTTLGNGDLKPATDFFEVLTGLLGASGLAMMTVAITYAFQVLNAVVNKRIFAEIVASMGESTVELLTAVERAQSSGSAGQLRALGERLNAVIQQHKAYPIVHYFHSASRTSSASCAVAGLDEAMRLYSAGLKDEEIGVEVVALRRTISNYLEHLEHNDYLRETESQPAGLGPEVERREGADLTHPAVTGQSDSEYDERRRLLAGLVNYDGWNWDDVIHGT